jgi:hypothetical protein
MAECPPSGTFWTTTRLLVVVLDWIEDEPLPGGRITVGAL